MQQNFCEQLSEIKKLQFLQDSKHSFFIFYIPCYRCSETLSWLDSNSLAEKEEFEDKLKALQQTCTPIMTKLHQAPGAKGPTVEEVDWADIK